MSTGCKGIRPWTVDSFPVSASAIPWLYMATVGLPSASEALDRDTADAEFEGQAAYPTEEQCGSHQ